MINTYTKVNQLWSHNIPTLCYNTQPELIDFFQGKVSRLQDRTNSWFIRVNQLWSHDIPTPTIDKSCLISSR